VGDLLVETPSEPPQEPPDDAPEALEATAPQLPQASIGQRVAAGALELLLFGVCLGVGWLLWWIVLWDHGTTPAKSVLKLRVVRLDGTTPSTWRMAAHELLAKGLLPLILVTSAVALVDDRRRSLWDQATGLVVISDRPEAPGTDPA
jgi:uncharacterized RDD family membrane protein YckC